MQTNLHSYYEDEDFGIQYEYLFDFILIHCTVNKWSPRVARKMYNEFGKFCEESKNNGYSRIIAISTNPKLAEFFGGKHIGYVEVNGKEHEVLEWV